MEYQIIATGSENCVIIEDIMIDCGVSFNRLKEYLYDVRYLLITHTHADHMKASTVRRIKEEFPWIKVIGNREVASAVVVDFLADNHQTIQTRDYHFLPFPCVHNVLTHGFVFEVGDQLVIYATDTTSLEHAPQLKYDYLFLECHHDRMTIDNMDQKGLKVVNRQVYHLSRQQAYRFYEDHRRNEDSKLIELHQTGENEDEK